MGFSQQNYQRFQDQLRQQKLDWAFLVPGPNFFYLTGIEMDPAERLTTLIVPSDNIPTIICPAFEEPRLRRMTWVDNFLTWEEHENPFLKVAQVIDGLSKESVGIDGSVGFDKCLELRKLGVDLLEVGSASSLLGELRIRKTESELQIMRKAGELVCKAVQTAFDNASVGMSEMELRSIIEQSIYSHNGLPKHVLVQFGPNSSYPHQDTTNYQSKRGDVVLIDIVAKLQGYCSDITRMAVLGSSTEHHEKIHRLVFESQKAARNFAKEGVLASKVDLIARQKMDEGSEKNSQFFTHRLGHGIGIEGHEPPYLVSGNNIPLEEGMAHSIEPGIYLEGRYGFRIEDTVAVGPKNVEILTKHLSRELVELSL
ncbi:MAG: M24 family metallopeptidase [Candidatus Hodarchaeales archaeon]|jgi:Xaa-Pro dipeptidase